jgi:hypothetical protein
MRIEEIRTGVARRLRGRRREIERITLTRVYAVSETGTDPEYLEGLRSAVAAAIEYGINAIESSEDSAPPAPAELLAQARLAARHGVKLETVLRRYLAGYSLLADFIIEESERDGLLTGASLKRLLRVQASLLDRLVAAVSEEYAREERARPRSAGERNARKVERLLAGEPVDTADLTYDFDAPHHLGAIATGVRAAEVFGDLVKAIDCRRLVIEYDASTVWVWLGSRRRIDPAELGDIIPPAAVSLEAVAVGEPGVGFAGWRLTHQQARVALPVARSGKTRYTRYGDVALLAAALQDDVAATSLQQLYLDPLNAERDGGEVARDTLRAYFASEQNMTSAAAQLGINRNTFASRLRAIEGRIGRPLAACGPELAVALRLDALSGEDD